MMPLDPLLRGLLVVSLVLDEVRRVWSAAPRHAVYWNTSNQRFLKEDYSVQVNINDYLEIYCPHYEEHVPPEHTESFTLLMVSRDGFRGCYETADASKRWECSQPYAPFGPVRFLEKIQRFTPFSLGHEFRPGQEYYYISIPDQGSAGRCLKLRVLVCCKSTETLDAETPKSQPRGRGGGGGGGGRSGGQDSGAGPATDARLYLLLLLNLALLSLWNWRSTRPF